MTLFTDPSYTLAQLRADLDGRVIAAHDPEYDSARTVVLGGIDMRPTAIVRPTDTAEVARVVALAGEAGYELAIRSGGHSGAGHSTTEGGIVLDLGAMRGLEINVEGRTAWAETGLSAGEYTNAVGAHGLATGFGDTGSVGIGGITLGGGVGFLSRLHGLTIDQLLGAEIVTGDGATVIVDADNEPDLFWAIRGGGGNFGVVTRFEFRLREVETVVGGMLMLPASAETVEAFIATAERAPEEFSAIANVMPAPPMPFVPVDQHGKLVIMALCCYAGPSEHGADALAPFRALAPAIVDTVQPTPYRDLFPPEPSDYHPTVVARTMFLDRVDAETATTIIDYLESSDASMRVAQLRVLGGAIARVPADATAYAHRDARIMANVAAFYDGEPDKPQREAWVEEFAAVLRQSDAGAYVNFLNMEGTEHTRAAYPGATYDRLAAVKARWDPTNLFRRNHNIEPA